MKRLLGGVIAAVLVTASLATATTLSHGRSGRGARAQPDAVPGLEHLLRPRRRLHRGTRCGGRRLPGPRGLARPATTSSGSTAAGRPTSRATPPATCSRTRPFPDGMTPLVDYIHAKGLRAGIYTDAGPYIPGRCGLGSRGHYQRDADQFAAWKFDAVKVDFLCGIAADLDPKTVYTEFAQALRNNAAGRPMIFNLCNPVTSPDWGNYPEEQQSTYSWTYAPAIAQSWRTYTDVGFVGDIKFKDVLRNYDANARHPEAAGPGHFNDPDYLGARAGHDRRGVPHPDDALVGRRRAAGDRQRRPQAQQDLDRHPHRPRRARDQPGPRRRAGRPGRPRRDDGDLGEAARRRRPCRGAAQPGRQPEDPDHDGGRGRPVREAVHPEERWTGQVTESAGTISAAVPAHGAALFRVGPATRRARRSARDRRPAAGDEVGTDALPDGAAPVVAGGDDCPGRGRRTQRRALPVFAPAVTVAGARAGRSRRSAKAPALLAGGSGDLRLHGEPRRRRRARSRELTASTSYEAIGYGVQQQTTVSPVVVAPAPPSGTSCCRTTSGSAPPAAG